ncbi:YkuS family protein [Pseudalkalibacillus caeni]|uniref:Gas vesicle protein n=1 Tax=Exobacillus caeni TaxID=2574798 RepID=A0A5R9F1V6_9BACL|nr:YkuS family protein [Pseudalkalibacillus caeni]TLS35438.1 hypothetical protein FCL54_20290 [Pseudalkalibacillus caeni]
MAKVAVEQPLTDVKQGLEENGFKVMLFQDEEKVQGYDCCVVRDSEDITAQGLDMPIVDARGRSVNEIVSEVEERLQRRQGNDVKINNHSTMKQVTTGILAGSIVGATAALLYAPKTGKGLRSDIAEKTQSAREKTMQLTNSVKEKSSTIKDSFSNKTKQAKNKVSEMKGSKNHSSSSSDDEYVVSEAIVANNGDETVIAIEETEIDLDNNSKK